MSESLSTPPGQKLRIFIDFWNFKLGLDSNAGKQMRPNWEGLIRWLVERAKDRMASASAGALQFEGAHIYLSTDPLKPEGKKLRRWVEGWLAQVPGVQVVRKDRRRKGSPRCPLCKKDILTCPHCGRQLIRMEEKGIDTAIVTDMIKLAWEDAWDTAVLVSSDSDLIPAVEFLADKGHKVLNARFTPRGAELARACWATIDLTHRFNEFATTRQPRGV